MNGEWVTLTEAARRAGYTRAGVTKIVTRYGIPSRVEGRRRLVSWSVLAEALGEHTAALSLRTVALRCEVSHLTLMRRLRRAGVLGARQPGRSARIAREDVAAIVRTWGGRRASRAA